MNTLSKEATLFCLPFEKMSTLKIKEFAHKEKILLPLEANHFLLEQIPFQKKLNVQECKLEITKVISLVQ